MGPQRIVLSCVGVGEHDSAAMGSRLTLTLPTQRATGHAPALAWPVEACMSIEADLEAFSPGRVAAVGVRGRLAEGERAF